MNDDRGWSLDQLRTLLREELRAERAAPQASSKTLRQIYELDEATWANQSWARQMRGNLAAGLRYFGERVADSITRSEWINWRDNVRGKETTVRKGNPTPFTLNFEITCWRTIYRRQLEEGNCTTNPLVGIRRVRGAKKHRETEPSVADVSSLERHCTPETWAFVLLAFQRGFRASEARRLEWRQVDLARGEIRLHAWQDKTRKAHALRITSDVVEALRAIKPDVPGRYVFPSPRTGKPYAPVTMWRWFRAAADAAALQAAEGDGKVNYHDLRHGFMSRATRRHGVAVAMRLSRHTSLAAAERYIHVDDRDLEQAYERMEEDARKPPQKTRGEPWDDETTSSSDQSRQPSPTTKSK